MEKLKVEGPVEESGVTLHFVGFDAYKLDAQGVSNWPPPGVHLVDFLVEGKGKLLLIEAKRYPEDKANRQRLNNLSDEVLTKFFHSYAATAFWKGALVPAVGMLVVVPIAGDDRSKLGDPLKMILSKRMASKVKNAGAMLPYFRLSVRVIVRSLGGVVEIK